MSKQFDQSLKKLSLKPSEYMQRQVRVAPLHTEDTGWILRNVGKGSCEAEPDDDDCIVKAYGHNGYFKSLADIVHFYNTRDVLPSCEEIGDPQPGANCWPEPEVAMNVNTDELGDLGLTAAEEDALVAFLLTLSDGYQP